MPELPEVENLRLSLRPSLLGRAFEGVEVRPISLREPLDRRALEALTSSRVIGLRRRAKYLWIDLDSDNTLVVHLGMSGRLTVETSEAPREAHEHVRFSLDDGRQLRYVDARRFGIVTVLPTEGLEHDPHFAHLGVEPLAHEDLAGHLRDAAHGRRGPIKTFLMNGEIVVGVGNIYASEVLWQASVHPRRSVTRVGSATWDRLARHIQGVLSAAIGSGGTTLRDYANGDGAAGAYGESLEVYGRANGVCRRCGRTVRSIRQSGRSTWYCPGCQH